MRMDSIRAVVDSFFHPRTGRPLMHSPVITDGDHPAVAAASAAAASKARFWDRVARKYASDPIADLAGYEGTLRRVQALLSPDHEVLEIGCGLGLASLVVHRRLGNIQLARRRTDATLLINRDKISQLTCIHR